jgi:hypothetical protein
MELQVSTASSTIMGRDGFNPFNPGGIAAHHIAAGLLVFLRVFSI